MTHYYHCIPNIITPRPPKHYNRFKKCLILPLFCTRSNCGLLFRCDAWAAWLKEDVVDTRTDTDQILFSRSRDTRSCSESCNGEADFSSWGIHLSICSGIYPDAGEKNSKDASANSENNITRQFSKQARKLKVDKLQHYDDFRSSYTRAHPHRRAHTGSLSFCMLLGVYKVRKGKYFSMPSVR